MPINITSNYSNPQQAIMQRFKESYKQEATPEKAIVQNNPLPIHNTPPDLKNISSNNIQDFLSVDEKRTLKEVFGDFNLDKKTIPQYNGSKYTDFLKGSQIDVKL